MGDRYFSFDANLLLSDGATPYTGSQATTVSGSAALLDLGGPTGTSGSLSVLTATDMARFDGSLIVTLSSIIVTTGCSYRLTVQGSNDPTFATGTCQNLGSLDFGISASRDGQASSAMTTATPAGAGVFGSGLMAGSTYELMFTTDQNSQKFRYIRCWLAMSGSGASIGFTAFVGVLPEA